MIETSNVMVCILRIYIHKCLVDGFKVLDVMHVQHDKGRSTLRGVKIKLTLRSKEHFEALNVTDKVSSVCLRPGLFENVKCVLDRVHQICEIYRRMFGIKRE